MAAAFASKDEVARRARGLRGRALEAGEADLHAYAAVLEAMRLPGSDPARRIRLEEALSRASEPPLAIARGALEVAELAADVAAEGRPALRGDAATAVLLAEAATRAAALLVEINLESIDGDPRVTEVVQLRERAASARAAALRPLSG
jgi:formiminotetrahydrofolate cyclodeaminase